ncbi:MAG: NAD-dependent deacylase [Planctomycetes bacterium]|nr:NAD-dependent deacylase [Planctomycetota bacterium]
MRILVLTGAGVSADSGLATFRGVDGLWEGHAIEEVASPHGWRRNPRLVWRFYQLRRAALGGVEPNAAHRALAELERACAQHGVEFRLVTQNVDNLHERAGSQAVHMHGELEWLRCERCGTRVRDLERLDPEMFVPCAACGAERLRPDIVWFGELVPRSEELAQWAEKCTHFVAIGTSGLVYPAAGLIEIARSEGAHTIVQSLDEPANLRHVDAFRPGRACEAVPALCRELAALLP